MFIYFKFTPYIISMGTANPAVTSDEFNNLYLSSYQDYGVFFQKKLNNSNVFSAPLEVMRFYGITIPVDINILLANKNIYITAGNGSLIFMTISSDHGDTWSSRLTLIDFGKVANSVHDLAIDSQGHLVIVYNNESVTFSKNSTDGIAWSAPREVGSNPQFSIEFDMADDLILVGSMDGTSIIYMRSSDEGYSWSPPENITTGINLDWSPLLRIDRYNTFHVWFLNVNPSYSRDVIHKRASNGTTWSSTIAIQGIYTTSMFSTTLNSDNTSVIVWSVGRSYILFYEDFIYAQGLQENYFTAYYMIPYLIGLSFITGLYWGISIILYVRRRRKSSK